MLFIWGRRVRDKKVSEGQFTCPTCRSQQKCTRRRVAIYQTIYFIPVAETKLLKEYLVCQRCNSQHDADSYADLGPGRSLEPVTWTCPECSSANPNHSFKCRQCGLSLV
jgi:hypothetical protein